MPRAKVRCGLCGNETRVGRSYKGRTLCPTCLRDEEDADKQAEKDKKPQRRSWKQQF